jgi:general secretion pathway protein D
MPTLSSQFKRIALLVTVLCLGLSARAQFPGFGGFGGFGGNSGRSGSSSRSGSNNRTSSNAGVGDAIISVDPETRSLVVIADEETSKYISQVVSNLDQPRPQVLIKVVFLEVTHSDGSDIGIEGQFTKNLAGSAINGFTTNFTVVSNAIVPSSINPITRGSSSFTGANTFGMPSVGSANGLYSILGEDYTVTLHAIATAGKTKVLSRPSVVARNNQPATITVGQSVPLITNVRFDTFGNAINSVTYTSVGIILRVTPFITTEGLVEMILSPETSELVQDRSQWVPISSGTAGTVSAPLINSRSADTVVVTPNRQTVIIGGLMGDTKAESESKIPYLGDIPLLGNLFKRKIKSDAKTELLIFLTPYVIDAPRDFVMLSESERAKSGAAHGLTEEELNHFLDNLPSLQTNAPAGGKAHKKK